MYHDEGAPPERLVLSDWPEPMSGLSAQRAARRWRPARVPRPPLILAVTAQPSLTPRELLPKRLSVPRFSERPAGTFARPLRRRFPAFEDAVARMPVFETGEIARTRRGREFARMRGGREFARMRMRLGQYDDEAGPTPTAPSYLFSYWNRREPWVTGSVPEGYRQLPSGEVVPLDGLGFDSLGMLGRRRGKKRGFFGRILQFHKSLSPVAWLGRQKIVRKILPRPVTTIMRGEISKLPGAFKRELLAPIKPLKGILPGGKKKKKPGGGAEAPIPEVQLAPEPLPMTVPPPAPMELLPSVQSFPPMPVAPPAPDEFTSNVPPGLEPPEEMEPVAFEERPDLLPPELVQVEQEAAPWPAAPEVTWEENMTFSPLFVPRGGELPGPTDEELLYPTELAPLPEVPYGAPEEVEVYPEEEMLLPAPVPSEEMMTYTEDMPSGPRLGRVVWWWQPTEPGTAVPFESLGQGFAVERVFRQDIEPVLRSAATILAPFAPLRRPAVPVPEKPKAPAMPGWVWPVVIMGGVGATVWAMSPQPRRRRRVR